MTLQLLPGQVLTPRWSTEEESESEEEESEEETARELPKPTYRAPGGMKAAPVAKEVSTGNLMLQTTLVKAMI